MTLRNIYAVTIKDQLTYPIVPIQVMHVDMYSRQLHKYSKGI